MRNEREGFRFVHVLSKPDETDSVQIVRQRHPEGVRALEVQLENAFERRFGRRVDTIVRPVAPFRSLTAGNPFPAESARDGSRVVVRIMRTAIDDDSVEGLTRYLTNGERLKVVHGDLWVHFHRV
jgi:uncharacterized protein (DUF1697 family)